MYFSLTRLFIHLFVNIYGVSPITVLCAGGTVKNQVDVVPAFMEWERQT